MTQLKLIATLALLGLLACNKADKAAPDKSFSNPRDCHVIDVCTWPDLAGYRCATVEYSAAEYTVPPANVPSSYFASKSCLITRQDLTFTNGTITPGPGPRAVTLDNGATL